MGREMGERVNQKAGHTRQVRQRGSLSCGHNLESVCDHSTHTGLLVWTLGPLVDVGD